jgi:hypothetical protein
MRRADRQVLEVPATRGGGALREFRIPAVDQGE